MCHCVSGPPSSGTVSSVVPGSAMYMAGDERACRPPGTWYTSDSGRSGSRTTPVVHVLAVDVVLVARSRRRGSTGTRPPRPTAGSAYCGQVERASRRSGSRPVPAARASRPSTPPRSIGCVGVVRHGRDGRRLGVRGASSCGGVPSPVCGRARRAPRRRGLRTVRVRGPDGRPTPCPGSVTHDGDEGGRGDDAAPRASRRRPVDPEERRRRRRGPRDEGERGGERGAELDRLGRPPGRR